MTMIQIQSAEHLGEATERARKGHLFVRPTGISRQYRVINRETGAQYTVDFFLRNGKRFGHCTCKGGMSNQACKHLSAAAALHICLSAIRYESRTSH
jgi:hypothetical protein